MIKLLKSVLTLTLCMSFVILLSDCNREKKNIGLQGFQRCFSPEGGNVSQEFYAPEDWSVSYDNNSKIASWLSISPSSGSGSDELINLQLTATVNNDMQSRQQIFYITIGGTKYTYSVTQDGREKGSQVCNF